MAGSVMGLPLDDPLRYNEERQRVSALVLLIGTDGITSGRR